jgi:hypothetical protein
MSQGGQSVTAPKGKRRRWLAAALLIGVVLALLWLGWWRVAAYRLGQAAAGMAEAGAGGEPPDEPRPALPPERNAATYYQNAIAAMSQTVILPSNSAVTFWPYPSNSPYPPYPALWKQMTEAAVAANGPALAASRKARQFDQSDWTPWKDLSEARGLANLIGDAAVHAHVNGDDAEAIERIEDLLHLADSICQNNNVNALLVAVDIEFRGLERLEMILPDTKISDNHAASSAAPLHGAASRDRLKELMLELLDDRKARRRWRQAIRVATAQQVGEILDTRSRTYVLRPMFDLNIARIFDQRQIEMDAMMQENWPLASAMLRSPLVIAAGAPRPMNPLWLRYSHMYSTGQGGAISMYVHTEFIELAERRAAATSIAVRLYRFDNGRWPQELAFLGGYIPQLPLDPTAPGKEPIGYVVLRNAVPEVGDRPLLYFESPTPDPGPPPPEPSYGRRGYKVQWRDLERWSPAKQSSR